MARLDIADKVTGTPLPDVNEDRKFTAGDCNKIKAAINGIDTEVIGLTTRVSSFETKVDRLEPPAPVIFNFDKSIEEGGIYIYTGVDEKTATIEDNIDGIIEFRNVGTGLLKLSGTFAPGFSEELYPRSQAIRLIWVNGYYTY